MGRIEGLTEENQVSYRAVYPICTNKIHLLIKMCHHSTFLLHMCTKWYVCSLLPCNAGVHSQREVAHRMV